MKADGTLDKRGRGLVESSQHKQKEPLKKKAGSDK
jgi:hypothetical protein